MSTPTSIEPGHPDHPTAATTPTTPTSAAAAAESSNRQESMSNLTIPPPSQSMDDVSPGAETSRLPHSKSHQTFDLLTPIKEDNNADEKARQTQQQQRNLPVVASAPLLSSPSPLSALSPGGPMSVSSPSGRREGEVEGNHTHNNAHSTSTATATATSSSLSSSSSSSSRPATPGHSRLDSHSRPDRIDASRTPAATTIALSAPPDSPLTQSKARAAVEESPDAKWVRYAVKLGSGSFKEVWLGIDTETGKEVAWNVIDLRKVNPKEQIRIRMETELLKKLRHPHIIEIYDVWEINHPREDRHELDFVTQKASYTLKQHIANLHPAKTKVLRKYSRQILTALVYLHSLKPPIIHRDLKCDNIFIDGATGDIRIGDFGLSISNYTATSIIGTPGFMAPELFAESYNELVDIWAFGMCVLEMATNQYPYFEYNGSVAALLKKGYEGAKPEGLSQVQDPSVREFILLCLQPVATRPSARQLLDQKIFDLSEHNSKPPTDTSTSTSSSATTTPSQEQTHLPPQITAAVSPTMVSGTLQSQPRSPSPTALPQQSLENELIHTTSPLSTPHNGVGGKPPSLTQMSLPPPTNLINQSGQTTTQSQWSATAPITQTTSTSPPQSTSPTAVSAVPSVIPTPLPSSSVGLSSTLPTLSLPSSSPSKLSHDAIIRQHADEIIPKVEVSKTDDPSVVCIKLHCRIKRSLVTQVINEEENEDAHEIHVDNEAELVPIDESDISIDERKAGLDRVSSNESVSSRGDNDIDATSPSATPSPPSPRDLTSIVISRYDFSRDNYLAVATALVRRVDGLQHFDWAGVEECVALKIEEGVREYYNKWTAKARTTINSEIMTLLTQLGITLNYAAKFIEQEVSIEDLMFLSEEDLVTFLPKLGPRRRLQQYIEAQKRLREEEEAHVVAAEDGSTVGSSALSSASSSAPSDADDSKKKKKKSSIASAEALKPVKVEKLAALSEKKDKSTPKSIVEAKKSTASPAAVILVATPAIPSSLTSSTNPVTVAVAVDEKKSKEKKLKASVAEELNAAKAAAVKQLKTDKPKADDLSAGISSVPPSSGSAIVKPKATSKLSIKPAVPPSPSSTSTSLERRRSDDDSPSAATLSSSSPSVDRTASPVKRSVAPLVQSSVTPPHTQSQPSTPIGSPIPLAVSDIDGPLKRTASTPAVQQMINTVTPIPAPQMSGAAGLKLSNHNHRPHSASTSSIVDTTPATKLKSDKSNRDKETSIRPTAQTPPSPGTTDRRFLDNNDTSGMNALLGKIALDLDPKKANNKLAQSTSQQPMAATASTAAPANPPSQQQLNVPPSLVVSRDRPIETSPVTSPTFARRNSASVVPAAVNGGLSAVAIASAARWAAAAQLSSTAPPSTLDNHTHPGVPRRRSMDETGHLTPTPLPPFYPGTTPNSPLMDQNAVPTVKPIVPQTPPSAVPSRIPLAPNNGIPSAYQGGAGVVGGGAYVNTSYSQTNIDASVSPPRPAPTYPPVVHLSEHQSFTSQPPQPQQRPRGTSPLTQPPQPQPQPLVQPPSQSPSQPPSHYNEVAHNHVNHTTQPPSLPSQQSQTTMSRMSAQR